MDGLGTPLSNQSQVFKNNFPVSKWKSSKISEKCWYEFPWSLRSLIGYPSLVTWSILLLKNKKNDPPYGSYAHVTIWSGKKKFRCSPLSFGALKAYRPEREMIITDLQATHIYRPTVNDICTIGGGKGVQEVFLFSTYGSFDVVHMANSFIKPTMCVWVERSISVPTLHRPAWCHFPIELDESVRRRVPVICGRCVYSARLLVSNVSGVSTDDPLY